MNNILLEEVKEIKNLGVFYDSLLVFDKHTCDKINKAYMMLGIIRRNFTSIIMYCPAWQMLLIVLCSVCLHCNKETLLLLLLLLLLLYLEKVLYNIVKIFS